MKKKLLCHYVLRSITRFSLILIFLCSLFTFSLYSDCLAQDSSSGTTDEYYYYLDHLYLGFEMSVKERILEHNNLQSETSIVNPNLLAGLEYNDFLFASIALGTASFQTDSTKIKTGFKAAIRTYADFYDFKQYYGSLRFQAEIGLFYGKGKTGSGNIDTSISYSDWNFMLLATSNYDPFIFYAGPLISLTRGSYKPENYDNVSFKERNLLGLAGGITFLYGDQREWRLTTEGRYLDYFSLSFIVTYSL